MLLNGDQGGQLLQIARDAIDARLDQHQRKSPAAQPAKIDAALQRKSGCFVTLTRAGRLRGCLGSLVSEDPLHREVARMAVAAATADPRFPAMTGRDKGNYAIEISLLSPLRQIDDPQRIEVGTHGIYLEGGRCRGLLLPQVANARGWDRETFLAQTCIKAGLQADAWRCTETAISIFTAQIISDNKDHGPQP